MAKIIKFLFVFLLVFSGVALGEATKNTANLRLISMLSEPNLLILKFSHKINKDLIKISSIHEKNNSRVIFDILAINSLSNKKINDSISKEIKIAQFDKKTTRIVFSNPTKQNINYEIDSDVLLFFIDTNIVNLTPKKSANSQTIKPSEKKPAAKSPKVSQTKPKQEPLFRADKIIVLDPGHGGKDAGAIGANKLYEKNVVLNIAKKAGKILKNRGYKVYFTRSSDKFIKLRDRTAFANNKKADIFVSIHANAAPNATKAQMARGIETFFLSPTRSERSMRAANLENKSDTDEMNYFTRLSFLNFLNREKIIAANKLAIDIQANLLLSVRKKFDAIDGGVREAPFWVLVGALMPAVLIEVGYITHPTEGKLLANEIYANSLAEGIANGIDEYFIKNR